jgi:hypothetical protein
MHQFAIQWRKIHQPSENREHRLLRVDLVACPVIDFISLKTPDRVDEYES